MCLLANYKLRIESLTDVPVVLRASWEAIVPGSVKETRGENGCGTFSDQNRPSLGQSPSVTPNRLSAGIAARETISVESIISQLVLTPVMRSLQRREDRRDYRSAGR